MEQLCDLYSIPKKEGDVADYWARSIETKEIPRDVLEIYNRGDIKRTRLIYEAQQVDQRMTPALRKLILIGGADLLVLQRMEENGIKYDKQRSNQLANACNEELNAVEAKLNASLPHDSLQQFNWDSGDHLSAFLYGGTIDEEIWNETNTVYKSGAKKGEEYVRRQFAGTRSYSFPGVFKPLPRSAVQKSTDARPIYSTAEPILRQLKGGGRTGKAIVELLLRRAELEKLANTYYSKIPALMEEMEWGDYVHGSYNQVVARTGRLSSNKPNMQNNPEVVDRMFISRFE
jgi:DNA polymerase I-like protein with 3'-5' exonuclease and polymerase domains